MKNLSISINIMILKVIIYYEKWQYFKLIGGSYVVC